MDREGLGQQGQRSQEGPVGSHLFLWDRIRYLGIYESWAYCVPPFSPTLSAKTHQKLEVRPSSLSQIQVVDIFHRLVSMQLVPPLPP